MVHIRREGNKVVHASSQRGVGLNSDVVWTKDYSPNIHDLVIADVNT